MTDVFCTQCRQANPPGARFCARCGHPLTAAPASTQEPVGNTTTLRPEEITALEDSFNEQNLADHAAAGVETLPAGAALLVIKRGPGASSRYLLQADRTTIGRHPDADILLDDVTVSRRHAEFHRHPNGFTVTDLGSHNGTYVNRERVDHQQLSSGDEVRIGRFALVYLTPRQAQPDGGRSPA